LINFNKIFNYFSSFLCLIIFLKASSSVDIRCNYFNNDFEYSILGKIYRCFPQNELNIISPETAVVESITGFHQSFKDNDQVIGFHSNGKNVQYIPKNLDKFFKNIKNIDIVYGRVKEIHQSDLKPFPKLVYCGFMDNDIEIIENDLFDYNPDLELVSFWNNKIFIIGSTAFDKLPKLNWLYLDSNRCINMRSEGVTSLTKYIIRHAKHKCKDPEISTNYKTDDQDFENLEMVQATINELKKNISSINDQIANLEENNIQLKAQVMKTSNNHGSYLWVVVVVVIFVVLFAVGTYIAYKKLNIYR